MTPTTAGDEQMTRNVTEAMHSVGFKLERDIAGSRFVMRSPNGMLEITVATERDGFSEAPETMTDPVDVAVWRREDGALMHVERYASARAFVEARKVTR
jgi:hypothetical protein